MEELVMNKIKTVYHTDYFRSVNGIETVQEWSEALISSKSNECKNFKVIGTSISSGTLYMEPKTGDMFTTFAKHRIPVSVIYASVTYSHDAD